jgi:single-strand DNA-binding protein
MNSIQITGRTTQDIQLKQTSTGKTYCKFRVAVPRTRNKDVTDFMTVCAWNKTAEFLATYCTKGSLVSVVGEMQTNRWEDTDGNKRTDYEIMCTEVEILSRNAPKEQTQGVPKQTAPAPKPYAPDIDNVSVDDLPFEL